MKCIKYKVSIKECRYTQESYGIVKLYNFIVSNYVEPLKPSNQMSTVKSDVNSLMSNY
jgi:hypothetical protein